MEELLKSCKRQKPTTKVELGRNLWLGGGQFSEVGSLEEVPRNLYEKSMQGVTSTMREVGSVLATKGDANNSKHG